MSGEAPDRLAAGVEISRRFDDPPTGGDETTRERRDYVSAVRQPTMPVYRPW